VSDYCWPPFTGSLEPFWDRLGPMGSKVTPIASEMASRLSQKPFVLEGLQNERILGAILGPIGSGVPRGGSHFRYCLA